MEIRRIRADEGLAFREVRLRALTRAPHAYLSTYEEEAALSEQAWDDIARLGAESMDVATFVLERGTPGRFPGMGDGDSPHVPFAGAVFVRVNMDPPHDAYIGAMWLDEDLRGSGWAVALLAAAEDFARRLGAPFAELWVDESNARALRLYQRQGYARTDVTQPDGRGGVTFLMRKDLAHAPFLSP